MPEGDLEKDGRRPKGARRVDAKVEVLSSTISALSRPVRRKALEDGLDCRVIITESGITIRRGLSKQRDGITEDDDQLG